MDEKTYYLVIGLSLLVPICVAPVLYGDTVLAQDAELQRHLEVARQSAGDEWTEVLDFVCTREAKRIPEDINTPDDPLLEPVRIFDNLYAIGRTRTIIYAITTSDGIILLDAGYRHGQVDSVLLPGMAQLGLDPADIKYIFVAHGHGDHYGGARALQERFGARVVLSAADWDMMEQNDPVALIPTRDIVVKDGEPISLGDNVVTSFILPGHTAGALGFIFSVYDGENTHTAAMFGGMGLDVSVAFDMPEGLAPYLASVDRFKEVAEERGVDVEIQNHPLFDGMPKKLEQLKRRRSGEPHPFVLEEGAYARFMETISECSQYRFTDYPREVDLSFMKKQ